MKAYTVVLSPEPESTRYSVSCPAMPGLATQGEDRDDALRNAREAMELWLEVATEHGEQAIPETPELIAEQIEFVLSWKAEEGWPLLLETAQVAVSVPVAA
jgi:predicted RNase H-like HicB family nuclease